MLVVLKCVDYYIEPASNDSLYRNDGQSCFNVVTNQEYKLPDPKRNMEILKVTARLNRDKTSPFHARNPAGLSINILNKSLIFF